MECLAIEIQLGGRAYEVPALPAVDWWPIALRLDLMAVLDLIEDPSLDDAMISGEVGPDELQTALVDALEAIAGRSLHVLYVLAITADQHWMDVSGKLALAGFRWDVMPLGAALDAIYATIVGSFQNQEDLDKFLGVLNDESLAAPGKKRTASAKIKDEFETMAGPKPTAGVRSTGGPSGNARSRTRSQPQPRRRGGPSGAPKRQPSPPAGSGPPASSARREGADEPASDTGPRPPQQAR